MLKILNVWKSILENGMKSSELFNFKKEGTIILSHYRSGGTQLRHILCNSLWAFNKEYEDMVEVDFDIFTDIPLKEQLGMIYNKSDKYKVIQLNNPMVISFLMAYEKFDEIIDRYNVVHLERKTKRKNILSLGVWEELIKHKLYGDRKKWTGENFENFHCELVKNPLNVGYIYLGVTNNMEVEPPEEYINGIFTQYMQIISMNRYITSTYGLLSISYEEYEEENNEFYDKYLKKYENLVQRGPKKTQHDNLYDTYSKTFLGKIPYFSKDFMDYYDETVHRWIKEWGF